jgi:hypothetical protein
MGVARRRRAVHGTLALSAGLALLLGGCATLPPAAPIPDIPAIAGQWRGNIQFGRGPYDILYVTISPDGGLVASWGSATRWGRVAVADGRARFELYIWSGDLQYLVGPGERIIVMKDDFLTFYAQATPLT